MVSFAGVLKRARSKTYWFNSALASFVYFSTAPEVQAVIPPDSLRWVVFAAFVANLWLREMTSKPISEK